MIGIIGAMEREISALRGQMTEISEDRIGISTIWRGRLYGHEAALALCGIGKVHAAMCAQAMILKEKPKLIVNIGVAGALEAGLDIADAVIASSAVQHDMDTSPIGDPVGMISGINLIYLPCEEGAKMRLRLAAQSAGIRVREGVVATGDRFIERLEEKQALRERFGALACDMEGAAIAQAAYEMGVPYASYRCISDTLHGNGLEYAVNADRAAAASQCLIRAFMETYGEEYDG
ncbi:MAG: 5'-methylthioadenosine/adenosylhomocysteine nucleosidase [Clostridia bacterium]|nr:5'-methylthioadenosine/adenosylhomocysteine nucleosidase [Clostridia bacterium]